MARRRIRLDVIEVADTGRGMSAAQVDAALGVFTQAGGNLNRRFEGTGLGLPLAKSISELLGGSFALASEPGKGTVVTLAFSKDRVIGDPDLDLSVSSAF